MVKKIGFLHTGVAIADMFKPMIAVRLPGVSTFHIKHSARKPLTASYRATCQATIEL
jgi:hypothetical protein